MTLDFGIGLSLRLCLGLNIYSSLSIGFIIRLGFVGFVFVFLVGLSFLLVLYFFEYVLSLLFLDIWFVIGFELGF